MYRVAGKWEVTPLSGKQRRNEVACDFVLGIFAILKVFILFQSFP